MDVDDRPVGIQEDSDPVETEVGCDRMYIVGDQLGLETTFSHSIGGSHAIEPDKGRGERAPLSLLLQGALLSLCPDFVNHTPIMPLVSSSTE
ncbi:MAG: hypothetical protein ACXV5Q_06995 [Frankiaceae bacterium]